MAAKIRSLVAVMLFSVLVSNVDLIATASEPDDLATDEEDDVDDMAEDEPGEGDSTVLADQDALQDSPAANVVAAIRAAKETAEASTTLSQGPVATAATIHRSSKPRLRKIAAVPQPPPVPAVPEPPPIPVLSTIHNSSDSSDTADTPSTTPQQHKEPTAAPIISSPSESTTNPSVSISVSSEGSSAEIAASQSFGSSSSQGAVASMEDVVTGMVLGTGAGGNPMGKSVLTIRDLIEKTMMPGILKAHEANQKELDRLAKDMDGCDKIKSSGSSKAARFKAAYESTSPAHKSCRTAEASLKIAKIQCTEEIKDKRQIKNLWCQKYEEVKKKVGNQNANKAIVTKGGGESVDIYVQRISDTICGAKGKPGMLQTFTTAKAQCMTAQKKFDIHAKRCKKTMKDYAAKKKECDRLQDHMDNAACQRAVLIKDSCESFVECYKSKKVAYDSVDKMVRTEEKDRKNEWKALHRMRCLINAMKDGKVDASEIDTCKKKKHSTMYLTIKYPKIPAMATCTVPDKYPTTAAYLKAEFAPLPALAKGKLNANECYGVLEISNTPKAGSPKTCKCERITMNGVYSPGPLVRCTKCLDVSRSKDKSSCPEGTKLFSPRSREDWKTFLVSAGPVRNPNWIIDVTRPQNGCGGCKGKGKEMNSGNKKQSTWVTSDGSPWWLRSSEYNEPNGDYYANCFLDLWHSPKSADTVTFNDKSCKYHSTDYYCQPTAVSTTPKAGSPKSCMCTRVALTGKYTAGALVKCTGCLDVSKAVQKNSCPDGTKIFAPSSQEDWKTLLKSAKPLRAPNWIVDVTRSSNGCGGCTRWPMNSAQPNQATWKTADNAPWWLRSTVYTEPNGDYKANCYLDLWQPPANEHSITFNDGDCKYHSSSYYCQPSQRK